METSGNSKESHDIEPSTNPKLEAIVYTTRLDEMNVFSDNNVPKLHNLRMALQQIEKASKPALKKLKRDRNRQISEALFRLISFRTKLLVLKKKTYANKYSMKKMVVDLTQKNDAVEPTCYATISHSDERKKNSEAVESTSNATFPRWVETEKHAAVEPTCIPYSPVLDKTENQHNLFTSWKMKQADKNLSTATEADSEEDNRNHYKTEIYDLDKDGNILGHYNNSYEKLKIKELNANTNLIFTYCCWYDRDKKVNKIAKRLNNTTLERIKSTHDCVPEQCNCCCKPTTITPETGVMLNVDEHSNLKDNSIEETSKKQQEVNSTRKPRPTHGPGRLVGSTTWSFKFVDNDVNPINESRPTIRPRRLINYTQSVLNDHNYAARQSECHQSNSRRNHVMLNVVDHIDLPKNSDEEKKKKEVDPIKILDNAHCPNCLTGSTKLPGKIVYNCIPVKCKCSKSNSENDVVSNVERHIDLTVNINEEKKNEVDSVKEPESSHCPRSLISCTKKPISVAEDCAGRRTKCHRPNSRTHVMFNIVDNNDLMDNNDGEIKKKVVDSITEPRSSPRQETMVGSTEPPANVTHDCAPGQCQCYNPNLGSHLMSNVDKDIDLMGNNISGEKKNKVTEEAGNFHCPSRSVGSSTPPVCIAHDCVPGQCKCKPNSETPVTFNIDEDVNLTYDNKEKGQKNGVDFIKEPGPSGHQESIGGSTIPHINIVHDWAVGQSKCCKQNSRTHVTRNLDGHIDLTDNNDEEKKKVDPIKEAANADCSDHLIGSTKSPATIVHECVSGQCKCCNPNSITQVMLMSNVNEDINIRDDNNEKEKQKAIQSIKKLAFSVHEEAMVGSTIPRVNVAHDCNLGQCKCCKFNSRTHMSLNFDGHIDLTDNNDNEKKKKQLQVNTIKPGPSHVLGDLTDSTKQSASSINIVTQMESTVNFTTKLDNVILRTLISAMKTEIQKPNTLETTKLPVRATLVNENNKYSYQETKMIDEVMRSLNLGQLNMNGISMNLTRTIQSLNPEAIVYTTRLEEMNVFKLSNIKMTFQQIEQESKPTLKGLIKQKHTHPSRILYNRMRNKLNTINQNYNTNISCTKHKLDDEIDSNDARSRYNTTILCASLLNKKDNFNNLLTIKNIDKEAEGLPRTIEVGRKDDYKSRCKTETYALVKNSNTFEVYHKGYEKSKIQVLNTQRLDPVTNLILNYCCWYEREKNVNKIAKKMNNITLNRVKVAHECVPGQCNCCCKPNSKTYIMFNVDEHSDVTDNNDRDKNNKAQEVSYNKEPGPSRCPSDLLDPTKPSVSSNSMLKQMLNAKLNMDNLTFKNQISTNTVQQKRNPPITVELPLLNEKDAFNYYETNMQDLNIGNIKIKLEKMCCWYAREKMTNKLKQEKQYTIMARSVRNKHLCSIDKCTCCCQPTSVCGDMFEKSISPETLSYTNESFSTPIQNDNLIFKGIPDQKETEVSTKTEEETNTDDFESEINTFLISILNSKVSNFSKHNINNTKNNAPVNVSPTEYAESNERVQTTPVIKKIAQLNPVATKSANIIKDLFKTFHNISLVVNKNGVVNFNSCDDFKNFSIEEMRKLSIILKYAQTEIDSMDETNRNYIINPVKTFYKNGTNSLMDIRESKIKAFTLEECSGINNSTVRSKAELNKNYQNVILKPVNIASNKALKRTITDDNPKKKKKILCS